ncbi:VWA domain-containing protein [Haloarcula salina]|uniref:VWA domain-containing protein n=1 Tax=Haloarcula salina TaxID=1429914 RepID=UPI003C6FB964
MNEFGNMGLGGKGLAVLIATAIVLSTITPVAGIAAAQSTEAGNQPTETESTPVATATPEEAEPSGSEVGLPGTDPKSPPTEHSTEAENQSRTRSNQTDTSPQTSIPTNLTTEPPIVKKYYAVQLIDSIETDGHRGQDRRVDWAHARSNRTLQYYQDPVRVNESRVFTDDAIALRQLQHGREGGARDDARRAARLVYAADNASAHVAVADARRVLDQYGDDEGTRGRERAAEVHLRIADRALDRAERTVARGGDRRDIASRARALHHLRIAHRQSQLALETVDRDTDPQVTIDQTADPVRDGNRTVSYRITGTVSTVRPARLDTVTITINDNRTVTTAPRSKLAAPGENVSYRAVVNLTERVNTIEVSVNETAADRDRRHRDRDRRGRTSRWTDDWNDRVTEHPSRDRANRRDRHRRDATGPAAGTGNSRGRPDRSDNRRSGRSWDDDHRDSAHDEENEGWRGDDEENEGWRGDDDDHEWVDDEGRPSDDATATLYLDGDGLEMAYERRVTGTDPLDFDSDSNATNATEADDGTIDGREDYDSDGLGTLTERDLGTDPMVADTDGDNLSDGGEQRITQTDPLNPDTDGDNVTDNREDPDNDTLTHEAELAAGTYPLGADPDGDGLTDPDELDRGTDPLAADTDQDFLADGAELTVPFNTDPLDPDTDGDGIVDGNETYTSTARNQSVGLTVDVTGQGNVAGSVSIAADETGRFDTPQMDSTAVSPVVDIRSKRAVTNATLTFEVDDASAASTTSQLAVFRWNESAQGFEPVNSTVDTSEGTVTADTEHFSRYVVLDVSQWKDSFTSVPAANATQNAGGNTTVRPLDVVLLMDTSGSMNGNDPNGIAKDAGKEFTASLLDTDRAAVAVFANEAEIKQNYTTDHDQVNQTIEGINYHGGRGGTAINTSLGDAIDYKLAHSNPSHRRAIVLLSDGKNAPGAGSDAKTIAQAERAAQEDITVYAVGFGGADKPLLREVANTTGGQAYFASDANELPEVFSRVATNTTGGQVTDSDGDGLPDATETGGFTRSSLPLTVEPFSTDPNNPDTDGDGLTDGEEVKSVHVRTQAFTVVTDGEAVAQSVRGGYWRINSNPTKTDTDGDTINDSTEVNGWNISVVNKTGHADPYRYDYACEEGSCAEPSQKITVTSDPKTLDTDEDGLTDPEEKNLTHTDPSAKRTYGITAEREQRFEQVFGGPSSYTRAGLTNQMGLDTDRMHGVEDRSDPNFTDASDSFDFVTVDSETGFDRYTFTGLDGQSRSDYWVSNRNEIRTVDPNYHHPGLNPALEYQTDPWDPDTDDDGLTDGQEMDGVQVSQLGETYQTDPTTPDTDDDGYWDGWIGVYGVGHTDNVVLYREHLQSGDGIEGSEIVEEQAGVHDRWQVHNVPGSVTAATVDYDNDGRVERSNLQVGELQWEMDPTTQSETVDLSIETDFVEGLPNKRLNDSGWERGIEENYALYGIDIDIVRDERVSDPIADSAPLSKSTDADQYMAVTTESIFSGTGFNGYATSESYKPVQVPSTGMYVYAESIANSGLLGRVNHRHLNQSPYENETQVVAAHVAMHEIGHSFGAGENDDSWKPLPFGEVYSGYEGSKAPDDQTPEDIPGRSNDWSVMRFGWDSNIAHYHNGKLYYPFSIEELTTVSEP